MIGWCFKTKNSKAHEKKPIEDDSDVDSTNNGEAHESTEADSEEEVSSDQENEVLRINEEQSSNVIHSLNSSSSSSSQSAIPKETESDKFAQKRKVSLEDDCSESATKCARNSYKKGISGSVHDALQLKVDSLEAQLLEYQTSWMQQQLQKFIGKNIRITARRIMKAKYPSPVIGFFADVDKDHISVARGHLCYMMFGVCLFTTAGMYRVRKNRMKRWNRQIIDNRSIRIGQALHQREANTIDISRAIDDDIIDASTISIYERVWSGSKKPTRTEMSLFLRPLIDELLNLERGEHFDFHDQDNNAITARVFLIGSCCDKPAQALLQFLPEPIAAFGYGRYEVKGFMVKTVKDGNVQSFATTCADLMEIQKRSNMRFDLLLDIKLLHDQLRQSLLERIDKALMMQHKIEENGITGPCIFRELSYFDVGNGFMADSLHNVYIGAFVRCVASLPK
ncbi:unnamed protein product [Rotaria magnacalcarata]|uniref:Uncharacterized protein n=2 Tax=Rotaria magnacalcarata TaxID=392030 RepID=A0A820H3G3_9BILA|nr:unnamed protein product [Rotaria magnacalcarata]